MRVGGQLYLNRRPVLVSIPPGSTEPKNLPYVEPHSTPRAGPGSAEPHPWNCQLVLVRGEAPLLRRRPTGGRGPDGRPVLARVVVLKWPQPDSNLIHEPTDG